MILSLTYLRSCIAQSSIVTLPTSTAKDKRIKSWLHFNLWAKSRPTTYCNIKYAKWHTHTPSHTHTHTRFLFSLNILNYPLLTFQWMYICLIPWCKTKIDNWRSSNVKLSQKSWFEMYSVENCILLTPNERSKKVSIVFCKRRKTSWAVKQKIIFTSNWKLPFLFCRET